MRRAAAAARAGHTVGTAKPAVRVGTSALVPRHVTAIKATLPRGPALAAPQHVNGVLAAPKLPVRLAMPPDYIPAREPFVSITAKP
jgi:hypothetical protein